MTDKTTGDQVLLLRFWDANEDFLRIARILYSLLIMS